MHSALLASKSEGGFPIQCISVVECKHDSPLLETAAHILVGLCVASVDVVKQ